MADERNDLKGLNQSAGPADNSADKAGGSAGTDARSDATGEADTDPNDELPVPVAMWPAEVDERAQVVEALRGKGPPPRTDTQVDPT